MEEKRKVKECILRFFYSGKISSIKIDGEVYDSYSKLPSDIRENDDYDIKVNKKFLKLFRDIPGLQKTFKNDFLEHTDGLIVNSDYRPVTVSSISHHARERFYSRYICYKYLYSKKYPRHHFTALSFKLRPLDAIFEEYLTTIDSDFKPGLTLNTFTRLHQEFLDNIIKQELIASSFVKNPKAILRRRLMSYGNTATAYRNTNYLFIYGSMDGGKILTAELKCGQKERRDYPGLGESIKKINKFTSPMLKTIIKTIRKRRGIDVETDKGN